MAATNAVKKPVTTVQKSPVVTTHPNATTRVNTLSSSVSQSPAVQQAAKSTQQTQAAGQQAAQQGTGIFGWQLPNIVPSLDQFLGLPTVIDWQDIGIRVSMVIVGIILVILVAWAFVRQQNITVNVPPPTREEEQK